jgi:hypothetical protein
MQCYKAKDPRAKAAYTLDAIANVAGFQTENGCSLKLGAKKVCVQVDKQNVTPTPPGGGPNVGTNAGGVLISYKLKCPKLTTAPVGLADQFGSGSFTVGTTSSLLVPSSPGPAIDHFKCYKTKDTRPKASYTMNLISGVAGFPNASGCVLKLGAKKVCAQINKQNVTPAPPGGGPGPGPNAAGTFLGYKVKCPKAIVAPATLTDQFGNGQFSIGTTSELLVPARLFP